MTEDAWGPLIVAVSTIALYVVAYLVVLRRSGEYDRGYGDGQADLRRALKSRRE